MDFPTALSKCLAGSRITNNDWNGKGMYVFAMPGYPAGVPANEALAKAAGIIEGGLVKVTPYLCMKNAKGEIVPWLISNMDVFSDGWDLI